MRIRNKKAVGIPDHLDALDFQDLGQTGRPAPQHWGAVGNRFTLGLTPPCWAAAWAPGVSSCGRGQGSLGPDPVGTRPPLLGVLLGGSTPHLGETQPLRASVSSKVNSHHHGTGSASRS